MPGDYAILYRDIRDYRELKDFKVRDVSGDKSTTEIVEYNEQVRETYLYYYGIWENWHCFNQLPNAGTNGTLKELPWILDFLKYFDRIYQDIENYRAEKRRRK